MSLKRKIQKIIFLEMKRLLSEEIPANSMVRRSGEAADQILKEIDKEEPQKNYERSMAQFARGV